MTVNRTGNPSPPTRARAYVGPGLLAVCALHIVVGVVDAAPVLVEAATEGWFGAFTGERATVLWFLMTGAVGVVAGVAITRVELSGRLPWMISGVLLATAGIGVSMATTSGFVLVLAVAILALARSWYTSRKP